jgi:hypothetical protein
VFAKREKQQFKIQAMETWLAEETQKVHTHPAGTYKGSWDLYSPEHMKNMEKYMSDWHRGEFEEYRSGSLRLGYRTMFGRALGYDVGGTLDLDGMAGDAWHIACKSRLRGPLLDPQPSETARELGNFRQSFGIRILHDGPIPRLENNRRRKDAGEHNVFFH